MHTYRLAHTADGWFLQVSEHLHADELHTHIFSSKQTQMLFRVSCLRDQQDSGVRPLMFRTVEALIEHYRRVTACGVSVAPLTDPLDRTRVQHISQGQGRAHANRQTNLCAVQ